MVLSQSTRVTDGQTDRQNYDSQDRANIAGRAVNIDEISIITVTVSMLCVTPSQCLVCSRDMTTFAQKLTSIVIQPSIRRDKWLRIFSF